MACGCCCLLHPRTVVASGPHVPPCTGWVGWCSSQPSAVCSYLQVSSQRQPTLARPGTKLHGAADCHWVLPSSHHRTTLAQTGAPTNHTQPADSAGPNATNRAGSCLSSTQPPHPNKTPTNSTGAQNRPCNNSLNSSQCPQQHHHPQGLLLPMPHPHSAAVASRIALQAAAYGTEWS